MSRSGAFTIRLKASILLGKRVDSLVSVNLVSFHRHFGPHRKKQQITLPLTSSPPSLFPLLFRFLSLSRLLVLSYTPCRRCCPKSPSCLLLPSRCFLTASTPLPLGACSLLYLSPFALPGDDWPAKDVGPIEATELSSALAPPTTPLFIPVSSAVGLTALSFLIFSRQNSTSGSV